MASEEVLSHGKVSSSEWRLLDSWLMIRTFTFFAAMAIFWILRLEWKRIKICRTFPGTKVRFLNIFGDVSKINLSAAKKMGYPPIVSLTLLAEGMSKVFCKEKIFCAWLSYEALYIATKAEAVEEIISGTKLMKKSWNYEFLHPWLKTGLLTSHGSKWKTRRKLLTPAFHFDILKDFLHVFNDKAMTLVRRMREETRQEYTDIYIPITLCSLDIICETTLGISIGAQDNEESQYARSVAIVTDLIFERIVNVFHWPDFLYYLTKTGRRFKKHVNILREFTTSVIREKKRKLLNGEYDGIEGKRKALLDLLLEHHISTKDITEEDIREEVETFAFEGHDTTATGMTWALYLLGLNPSVLEKVQEELDSIFGEDRDRPASTDDLKDMHYLECVLKESQRLYPPVPVVAREADQDITICGKRCNKGSSFMIPILLVHKDESVFPNPEVFDPTRFFSENAATRHPYAYIPFSAGPRNCIGQRFALMEEKVVLSTFLRHYSVESLDPRDKILPSMHLVLRPSAPLRIKIRPRERST